MIRACRELGVGAIAVYSDADRAALHVLHADEAYRLGPAPASESYLRGDLILEIARKAGADAIHPGYGFLSENADFAEACAAGGIVFIGPSSAAMRSLGSKTQARQLADRIGVPRVPGSTQGLESAGQALTVARDIGYPVMLKAAAGGGGKGMRAVHEEAGLEAAYMAAASEAERAFGSNEVYLEKLILRPRHIEIQLIADQHGNCVYLGERECSVQRRHQKVIEEAPSPFVDASLRQRMGETAVKLALAAGYTNAGTVEFLVDEQTGFYFLEMNTRLQVEHPVTEMVTGLDLVHLQIQVAEGRRLPIAQKDVHLRGHAIECRVYAEDPENNFFPSPGRITRLVQPGGPGLREDCGVYEGWTVPMDYDPMLSKLVAYAGTREAAIDRMMCALDEYVIGGIRTNLQFFQRILADPNFRAGRIDTGFLDRLLARRDVPGPAPEFGEMESESRPVSTGPATAALLAAAVFELLRAEAATAGANQSDGIAPPNSAWRQAARREALRP